MRSAEARAGSRGGCQPVPSAAAISGAVQHPETTGEPLLERTFIHCAGVGPKREQELWAAGLTDWDTLLTGAATGLAGRIKPTIAESRERLAARNHRWFARALPPAEHWRAAPAFMECVAFLDIETSGSGEWDQITVLGLSDGSRVRQFVRNENLRDAVDVIAEAGLIVTFFGTGFDLPFIRREMGIDFPQLHVDLCFLLRRLGYRGGLKAIERELGIARSDGTRGMSGLDAVRLWWRWVNWDDEDARSALLAYNAEDVANMAALLDFGVREMTRRILASSV